MEDLMEALRLRSRKGDVRGVRGLIKLWSDTGMKRLEPGMWTQLLRAYRARHDLTGAMKVIKEIKGSGVQPNSDQYCDIFRLMRKKKVYRQAYSFFFKEVCSWPEPPTVDEFNMVLYITYNEGNVSRAKQILAQMQEMEVEADRQTYIRMIALFGKANDLETTESLFQEMRARGFEPTIHEFTSLLSACTSAGDARKALKYFRDMIAMRLLPDVITLNTLLSAFVHGGELSAAEEAYTAFLDHGFVPNKITYDVIIVLYAKQRKFPKAEQVLDDMRRAGFTPDEVLYRTLMHNYIHANQCGRGEKLMFNAIRNGLVPSEPRTLSFLLSCFTKGGELAKANRLFELMLSTRSTDRDNACAIMMNGYTDADRAKEAVGLFDRMRAHGMRPDNDSTAALMRALGALHQVDKALALFSELRAPNGKCYGQAVHLLLNTGRPDEATELYEKCRATGNRLTRGTYEALMRAFSDKGDLIRTRLVFQDLVKELRIKPTVEMYMQLVEAHVSASDKAGAIGVLEQMKAAGLQAPDADVVLLENGNGDSQVNLSGKKCR